METTRVLPGFVGGQRGRPDLTGWRVGQLSWVGRVAALRTHGSRPGQG